MKISLFEHNRIAYEKTQAMLDELGRAAVIHPTGTGKSYIAFALVEEHPDKHFLWLAPSEYIYSLQAGKLLEKQGLTFSNVEFHTYAWLIYHEDMLKDLAPDAIILDEFHRAGAEQWGKCVNDLIAMYPEAWLFGMSATNVRYLDGQRDMAEELFEGAIASEMSLCEAMAKDILPEPKYVISVYSYEEKLQEYVSRAAHLKNKRQAAQVRRLIEKLRRTLQEADGPDRIFKKHLPRRDAKVILFCSSVDHMEEMMEKARTWFRGIDEAPHIYRVDTYNPDATKDFQEFVEDGSGNLKLLYCIDMLNEGIHVDDVDAVVLCRPTVSPIVYKQQIGRAIAAGSTRKPVIFDMVNNFDSLYQIDALKDELNEMMYVYGSDCASDLIGGFTVIDELRDCRKLMEQIQQNLDAAWDIYYQELCCYVKENGTAKVPKRYATDDGLYLGCWLQRQRVLHSEGKLPEARALQLETAGVVWETDSDQRFEHWIKLLQEYRELHGDLLVSGNYETTDGEKLGQWCSYVRRRYRQGRLPQERTDELERVGFVWETAALYWEEGYRHARAYYEEHGNLDASKRYTCADGFRLGFWLYTQRAVREGRVSGNLTDDNIRQLDAIGMSWTGKRPIQFDDYLEAFQKYKAVHGDERFPSSYVDEDGVKLGQWAARMNRLYFSGKLTEEKKEQLEEIGFRFHSYTTQWLWHYQEAKEFYDKYGSLHVPVSYTKEYGGTLAQWVYDQRSEYRKEGHGNLGADQVKLLEGIHIESVSCFEEGFERGLKMFREYVAEHHDGIVPSGYTMSDGYRLGKWISRQKALYKNGTLDKGRIKALEEAGMVWESTEAVRAARHWDQMYESAKRYADAHGSLKGMPSGYTTADGRKLGSWIVQQRRIRKGKIRHSVELDERKIGMLDEIGMSWGR